MSELRVKYNHKSEDFSLEEVEVQQPSANIFLRVDDAKDFLFKELRVSVKSEAEGVEVETHFPGDGVVIEGIDDNIVLAARVSLIAGQTSSFSITIDADGRKWSKQFDVETPLPEQPFPSWILSGNVWVAPKPYPENFQTKTPVWDESILDWRMT